jgi:hypothetical protein
MNIKQISEEIIERMNKCPNHDKYISYGDWYMDIYRDDEDYTSIKAYATNLLTNKTYSQCMSFDLDEDGFVTKYNYYEPFDEEIV